MGLNRFSRHRFSLAYRDEDAGVVFLSERVPYTYRDFSDNQQHRVQLGDTLWTLAGKRFKGMPRPSGFWWVIADFQPDRIFDPTLRLVEGTIVVLPSLRVLQQEILNERRKQVIAS